MLPPAGKKPLLAVACSVATLSLALTAGRSAAGKAGDHGEVRSTDTWQQRGPAGDGQQDEVDEIAALEAIRIALSEVGDGSAYVWHRRYGRLGGFVQPTTSFKDPAGRVCRHIVLLLTRGERVGRAEGVACRLGDGRWQLDR